MRYRNLILLAATPLLMANECEPPLIEDSGFDLWCGDTLCDWQVDAGSVAKVPTWNEHDYGVALVGSTARISQLLPDTSADLSCIHFELLANVDPSVSVVLALDFDDGAFEHTEIIPSGAWTPLSYHFTTPTYFQSVRISITKQGDGPAALAQIAAAKSSDCTTPPPVEPLSRPPGANCEMTSQCAAGQCLETAIVEEHIENGFTRLACEACTVDSDCAAGSVCALGFSAEFLDGFRTCAPAAAALLGDRCLTGADCATGVCCGSVCSTCCTDGGGPACAGGDACAERAGYAYPEPNQRAWQCAPGAGHGAQGADCLGDADCASGSCAGGPPLTVCVYDGRRCATRADCPGPEKLNFCVAAGVSGGKCQ
jgi:hypothetical protein